MIILSAGLTASSLPASATEEIRQHALAEAARLAPLETTDFDALTLESDFTVFMDRSCPEALRRKALRRLWRLLPRMEVPENTAI